MKRDIFALLTSAKDRVDVGYMEKYITEMTSNKVSLIDDMLDKVDKLVKYRYNKYGTITIDDCLISIVDRFCVFDKIKSPLRYIQTKMREYKFREDVSFWRQVEQNWNNAAFLLGDLLEIENFNLCLFRDCLEERKKVIQESPKDFNPKYGHVTMHSNLTEDELKCVYNYIKKNTTYFTDDGNVKKFVRIFSSYSVEGVKKIKLRKKRGAKAYLRALIEELTGRFDSKIVNMCFCYEGGSSLNISSHDRPQKGVLLADMLKC